MALSATSVSWRGITIAGPSAGSSNYLLRDLTGWEELPNITFESVPTGNGYGSIVTPPSVDPRVVTVSGWCFSPTARDSLLSGFWVGGTPSVGSLDTEQLTISHGGLSLSADAQLMKASAAPEAGWAAGRFGFVLTWRCPDPLRYGAPTVVSAPITPPSSGMTPPLTPPLTPPSNPIGGQATVRNSGNAPAPVLFTLQGPLDTPGVVCLETSKRLEFGFNLGASDVLTIDTAEGVARLNGEYRSPTSLSSLTGELTVPGSSSVTFQAVGTASTGAPSLSVWFRPAYW